MIDASDMIVEDKDQYFRYINIDKVWKFENHLFETGLVTAHVAILRDFTASTALYGNLALEWHENFWHSVQYLSSSKNYPEYDSAFSAE